MFVLGVKYDDYPIGGTLKELLRLLDLHAGRCLKINIDNHPFYISSTVKEVADDIGDSKVMIEDARDGLVSPEKIVSCSWLDISLFIYNRYPFDLTKMTIGDLYMTTLNLVVQEFSKPMIPYRYMNDQLLKEALDKVIQEEPLIQNAIKTYK